MPAGMEMKILRRIRIIALLMVLVFAFTACAGNRPAGAVAKVNKEYITKEVFDAEYNLYRQMFYGMYDDDAMNEAVEGSLSLRQQLSQQVTNSLVMSEVLRQALEKNNVEISEEDIAAEKELMAASAGGMEALQTQMDESGIGSEELDKIIIQRVRENALKKWYFENHGAPEDEVQAYYEDHKDALVTYDVSHILVETEEEAKKVLKELDGGQTFEALAEEYSIDPSGANGGELGEVTMTTNFVPEFLDAMAKLGPGEISGPVKTEFGYHIIRVNTVKESVEDLKNDIQEILLDGEYNNYVSDLFTESDIEIYMPAEKAPNRDKSKKDKEDSEDSEDSENTDNPEETSEEVSE